MEEQPEPEPESGRVLKLRPEIITLYRYFAFAAHMRDLFRNATTPEAVKAEVADAKGLTLFLCSAPGMYLLYSYSGIYVVIEAWKELKLTDPKIDTLLGSPFVNKLRRFRNATFHYQPELLSLKHLEFFGTEEEKTEVWLNDLYRELERFFRENTLPLPAELKEVLKNKPIGEITQAIQDYWAHRMSPKQSETEKA